MKWSFKKIKGSTEISPSPPLKKKKDPSFPPTESESFSLSNSESYSLSLLPSLSPSISASVLPSCDPYWNWISPSQPPIIKTRKKITKPIIQESPEEREKREKFNAREYKRIVEL